MPNYYVNTQAQSNGDHEVHKDGCVYLPSLLNRKYLGNFSNCQNAVIEAKKFYRKADGCYTCSRECHNS